MFWDWLVAITLQILNDDCHFKTEQGVIQFPQVFSTHCLAQCIRKTHQESHWWTPPVPSHFKWLHSSVPIEWAQAKAYFGCWCHSYPFHPIRVDQEQYDKYSGVQYNPVLPFIKPLASPAYSEKGWSLCQSHLILLKLSNR